VPGGQEDLPPDERVENLFLGAWVHGRDYPKIKKNMAEIFELFPILNDRQNQMAGTLSGESSRCW